MATFKLTISTDNEAFQPDVRGELVRLLRKVADRIDQGDEFDHYRTILDTNGNDVGRFALKDGE